MLNRIVVLNLSLLATHQADAAFWREWEMFNLPGGIQLFCLLNALLLVILLAYFVTVIERRPSGFTGSLIIAGVSALVLPIHGGLAAAGVSGFELPFSIFLIVATFAVSLWQAVLTFRRRHQFTPHPAPGATR